MTTPLDGGKEKAVSMFVRRENEGRRGGGGGMIRSGKERQRWELVVLLELTNIAAAGGCFGEITCTR